MQSPTMIAGLHRIATSLWLHSVASPQRMPASAYRHGGPSVVSVIYRVPPPSLFPTTSALPRGMTSGASGYEACPPHDPIQETHTVTTSTDSRLDQQQFQATPSHRDFQAAYTKVQTSGGGKGTDSRHNETGGLLPPDAHQFRGVLGVVRSIAGSGPKRGYGTRRAATGERGA